MQGLRGKKKFRMEKLIEREKEAMNNCKGGQEHKEDIGLEKMNLTESNELEKALSGGSY